MSVCGPGRCGVADPGPGPITEQRSRDGAVMAPAGPLSAMPAGPCWGRVAAVQQSGPTARTSAVGGGRTCSPRLKTWAGPKTLAGRPAQMDRARKAERDGLSIHLSRSPSVRRRHVLPARRCIQFLSRPLVHPAPAGASSARWCIQFLSLEFTRVFPREKSGQSKTSGTSRKKSGEKYRVLPSANSSKAAFYAIPTNDFM